MFIINLFGKWVKSDYISDLTDGIFGDVNRTIYQDLLHIQLIRVTEPNTMRIYKFKLSNPFQYFRMSHRFLLEFQILINTT